MFDFHMHTTVSYDGISNSEEMVAAAVRAGLKEICFTDHVDHEITIGNRKINKVFDTAAYNAAYDHLRVPGLKIRLGMEFGFEETNQELFRQDLMRREFDFVIGSGHFLDGVPDYFPDCELKQSVLLGERRFLEETLTCVRAHDDFDILGHLTYISKSALHPTNKPVLYENHREVVDEILRTLVEKGKGMEINTSGVDRCGDFLPSIDYLKRFKELGGEIVTVGSDAHDISRVGQYTWEACKLISEIFGHVCTFEKRKPIFHKI